MGFWLYWPTSNHWSCWQAAKIPKKLKSKDKKILEIILKLLSWNFFVHTSIVETSNALVAERMTPLTEKEFLWYLGLWFLMATVCGFSWSNYWSTIKFDKRTNPSLFTFFAYISKQRFDAITRQLFFTLMKPPAFADWIWEVREMIVDWNKNMAAVFFPSWVVCLDESMSIWHSIFTCSGCFFALYNRIHLAMTITLFAVQIAVC